MTSGKPSESKNPIIGLQLKLVRDKKEVIEVNSYLLDELKKLKKDCLDCRRKLESLLKSTKET